MRLSLLPIIVLAMPILEIAGFILVGKAIGLWPTLALIVLTSFLGLVLLRNGGFGMVRNLRAASQRGEEPVEAIMTGGTRVLAGILLFVPGFITDILGLMLLIAPIRALLWKLMSPKIVVAGDFKRSGFKSQPYETPSSKVVDLDEDDFRREGNSTSPWSKDRDDRDLPKP